MYAIRSYYVLGHASLLGQLVPILLRRQQHNLAMGPVILKGQPLAIEGHQQVAQSQSCGGQSNQGLGEAYVAAVAILYPQSPGMHAQSLAGTAPEPGVEAAHHGAQIEAVSYNFV